MKKSRSVAVRLSWFESFANSGRWLLTILGSVLISGLLHAEAPLVSTVTGGVFADGTGAAARFYAPSSAVLGADNNLYVVDASNHRIRRVTPAGVVTTFAGSGLAGYADGAAAAAKFNSPAAIAVDTVGNFYVADAGNNCVRKIGPDGTVTTLAGSTEAGYADGVGGAARFNRPSGIAVETRGNSFGKVYVADTANHRIRTISASGVVTTLAGYGLSGFADGAGTVAQFSFPQGLALGELDTVFVADTANHRIRQILPDGSVSSFAGSGTPGSSNGTRLAGRFLFPSALCVRADGTVFVADQSNHVIRQIQGDILSTVAGSGTRGAAEGVGTAAQFNFPGGVVASADGAKLYVVDSGNHRIREISSGGQTTTLAGGSISYGSEAGAVPAAPNGVAVASDGSLYLADTANHRVHRVSPLGVVTLHAGTGVAGLRDGAKAQAQFNAPTGLAIDTNGDLYVADTGNKRIRRVVAGASDRVEVMAGGATFDATASALALDANRSVFFANSAEANTAKLFKLISSHPAYIAPVPDESLALTGEVPAQPSGIAVASNGTRYLSDSTQHRILAVTATGEATVFAGSGVAGFADATGRAAQFNKPMGLVFDANGNLFVADSGNRRIRKITPAGIVTTLAGTGDAGQVDGPGHSAAFANPTALAIAANGDLYVADETNHAVRLIQRGVNAAPLLTGPSTVTLIRGQTVSRQIPLYGRPEPTVTLQSGSLPTGVTLTGTAGFAGTPTELGDFPIVLRAASSGGSTTKSYTVQVRGFTVAQFNATIARGQSYEAALATNFGGAPVFAVASGALPAGMVFSKTTGQLSGTPTVAGRYTGTFSATADGFVATLPYTIEVTSAPVAASPTVSATLDVALVASVDLQISGYPAPSFALQSGALPAGMTLTDGKLIGRPSAAGTFRGVVRATNSLGSTNVEFALSVTQTRQVVGTLASGPALASLAGVAVDSTGNVFVADPVGHKILRVSTDGVVTVFAGAGTEGLLDGAGSVARFKRPTGLVFDTSGNLYVADAGNNRIRRITPGGVVSTWAGGGTFLNGVGTAASFSNPTGIAIGSAGELYVADANNNRIRKIAPNAAVTTFAGSATAGAVDAEDGTATFSSPRAVAVDAAGNVFVADYTNNKVRQITPEGAVTTVAAFDSAAPALAKPVALWFDGAGALHVVEEGRSRILKLTTDGALLVLSDTAAGNLDGDLGVARFQPLTGGAVDANGVTYLADPVNRALRSITQVVTSPPAFSSALLEIEIATGADFSRQLSVNGGTNTTFDVLSGALPAGLTLSSGGLLSGRPTVLGESTGVFRAMATEGTAVQNFRIAVVAPPQLTSATLSDTLTRGSAFPSFKLAATGFPAPVFSLQSGNLPPGLTLAPDGTLNGTPTATGTYTGTMLAQNSRGSTTLNFSFTVNEPATPPRDTALWVTTPAGGVFADSLGTTARFNAPAAVALGSDGTTYVADTRNHRIRKVSPEGNVTTLAGSGASGYADGFGRSAQFSYPSGVAVDSAGVVYVADSGNDRIRKINPDGTVLTLAGSGEFGFADGAAMAAKFATPVAVALDGNGGVLVADQRNHRIRRIAPDGTVSTWAGSGAQGFADGDAATAQFAEPAALAVDGDQVYVADSGNHRVRVVAAGRVTTFAGTGVAGFADDCVKTQARFNAPQGVAVSGGLVYVADTANQRIRAIRLSDGWVNTVAGNGDEGSRAGAALAAQFSWPTGLAVDASGNLVVADTRNNRIRRVSGVQSQRFVDFMAPFPWDAINSPGDGAFDAQGNFFWTETRRHQVKKLSPDGRVTVFAGDEVNGEAGNSDGAGTAAKFFSPLGIASDLDGNLYVADESNYRIRKITPLGLVSTLAGYVGSGVNDREPGDVDGDGPAARFRGPKAIAFDRSTGVLYVLDVNAVRRVTPAGNVITIARGVDGDHLTVAAGVIYVASATRNGILRVSLDGSVTKITSEIVPGAGRSLRDGPLDSAIFYAPTAVEADAFGNLYVAEPFNGAVRKISPSGFVTTLTASLSGLQAAGLAMDGAGDLYVLCRNSARVVKFALPQVSDFAGGLAQGARDGLAGVAEFGTPAGLALAGDRSLYVADQANHRIRRISADGVVGTLAGTGATGRSDGAANAATFFAPGGVAVTPSGVVFVADTNNHLVRRVQDGVVTTFAGTGTKDFADAMGTAASFALPADLALGADGVLRVADAGNHRIRLIAANGAVTTLAGSTIGYADGQGTAARFHAPEGVAVATDGTVYVADTGNNRIRKITAAGVVTTLAGGGTEPGFADGVGSAARFNAPRGIVVDAQGVVYVADSGNLCIRRIGPNGTVTTLAGSRQPGNADGDALSATFASPVSLALDTDGSLWVGDADNHALRKVITITFTAPVFTSAAVDRVVAQGQAVELAIGAAGGPPPVFSVASGSLPPGVVLSTGGTLIGVPQTVGTYTGTWSATNARGTAVQSFRLVVTPRLTPPVFTAVPVNVATLSTSRIAITVPSSGYPAPVYSVQSGALPPGVTLSPEGLIEGVGAPGFYRATIALTNSQGVATQEATFTISAPQSPPWFNSAPYSHRIPVGAPYSHALNLAGNPTPQLTVSSGALPPGLTVSLAGVVSGTPSTAGIYRGLFTATNIHSSTDLGFSYEVYVPEAAPVFVSPPITTDRASTANTYQRPVLVSGFPTPIIGLQSGNLPPGLTLTSDGLISGTPQIGGTFSGVFVATNRNGSATQAFTLVVDEVDAPPRFLSSAFTNVSLLVGTSMSTYLTAVGLPAPTFGVASGSLPPGLTLSTSGHLQGAPTASGSFSGEFVATNSSGSVRQAFSFIVLAVSQPMTTRVSRFAEVSSMGVALDRDGGLLVIDRVGSRLLKYPAAGGSATVVANLFGPTPPSGVTVDGDGNYYVAIAHAIFRVVNGAQQLWAGDGSGRADGQGDQARFSLPVGLTYSPTTNLLYIADSDNHQIRRMTPAGLVTTAAGSGSAGFADALGTAAQFNSPFGVAVDAGGSIYVADYNNHRVRKIAANGAVSTVVGPAGLSYPEGVAVDQEGALYYPAGNSVRKLSASGQVTTLATSDAGLINPGAMVVTSDGTLYVADRSAGCVFKIEQIVAPEPSFGTGPVNVVVAPNTAYTTTLKAFGVPAPTFAVTSGQLPAGWTLTADGILGGTSGTPGVYQGTFTITNSVGSAAQEFSITISAPPVAGGVVAATFQADVAITPLQIGSGFPVGAVTVTKGALPAGLTIGADGALSGTPTDIGEFSGVFEITNVVGSVSRPFAFRVEKAPAFTSRAFDRSAFKAQMSLGNSWAGRVDVRAFPTATLTVASGALPPGLTLNTVGLLEGTPTESGIFSGEFRAENSVGSTTQPFTFIVFAGAVPSPAVVVDTPYTFDNSFYSEPRGLQIGADGTLYVAFTSSIAAINRAGQRQTIAGDPVSRGQQDGSATAARFDALIGLARLPDGTLLSTESNLGIMRRVSPTGVVSTSNYFGFRSWGVAANAAGMAVIATDEGLLRSFSDGSVVNWLMQSGFQDGPLDSARLSLPTAVAFDRAGNLYVADSGNSRIRKISTDNIVSTILGPLSAFGIWSGSVDGPAGVSRINYPRGVAVDLAGNVYATDFNSQRIRMISPAGIASTIAGTGAAGSSDGLGSQATFTMPEQIAVDPAGETLYVTEFQARRIRRLSLSADPAPHFVGDWSNTAVPRGSIYQARVLASGYPAPSFTVASGALPAGLTLDSDGLLHGTATDNGVFTGQFRATNSAGSAVLDFQITVGAAPATTTQVYRDSLAWNVAQDRALSLTTYPASTYTTVAVGLPPGVTLSADGRWQGTPTVAGVFGGVLTLRNSIGTGTIPYELSITGVSGFASAPLTRASVAANVAQGASFTYELKATAAPAAAFSVVEGALPPGLVLSSTGAITGAPTQAGVFTGVFRAANEFGQATQPFTLIVYARLPATPLDGRPNFASAPLLQSIPLGSAYSFQFALGGDPLPTVELISGALPPGLTLAPDGKLSGTPTSTGRYTGTIQAGNDKGSVIQAVMLDVTAPAKFSQATVQPQLALGAPIDLSLGLSGFPAPTVRLATGALPPGVTLGSNGTLTGTPTATGTFAGTISAENEYGTDTLAFTITAGQSPDLSEAPFIATLTEGASFSANLAGNAFPAPTFAVQSGELPPGLTLSAGGALAGSPTMKGVFTGVFVATNFAGEKTRPFALTVEGRPTFTSAALNRAAVAANVARGVAFNYQLTALAVPAATFAVQSGALPPGLSLAADGSISGTPTTAGVFTGAFAATNGLGTTTQPFTFVIYAGRAPTGGDVVTTLEAMPGLIGGFVAGRDGSLFFYRAGAIYRRDPEGSTTKLAGEDFATGGDSIDWIEAMAIDGAGNLYCTQRYAQRIIKVSPTGVLTVLAGGGGAGATDGPALSATFSDPCGIARDNSGNLYIADRNNHRIRKLSADGTVSTVAGSTYGYADGAALTAQFAAPEDVKIDSRGVLFVADCGNARVRSISREGIVSTYAGQSTGGSADGPLASATFSTPWRLVLDRDDNLYVADRESFLVRRISPLGEVTTLAGNGSQGHTDGPARQASLNYLTALTRDVAGNIYFTETDYTQVRIRAVFMRSLPRPIFASPRVNLELSLQSTVNEQLFAGGDAAPAFVARPGTLPPGLQLQNNGVLSGTLTTAGVFNGELVATNNAGQAVQNFSITVTSPPIFTTAGGNLALARDVASTTSVPVNAYPAPTFTLVSGDLPPGISLAEDGRLVGTPTSNGTYTSVVSATNSLGAATQNLSILVGTAPTVASPSRVIGVPSGAPFALTLEASAVPAATWTLASGTLPAGLALRSDGLLSGTTSATGVYSGEFRASNSLGAAIQSYVLTVAGLPVFTAPNYDYVFAPGAIDLTVALASSTTAVVSLQSGTLPSGLTLSSSGRLSGTATTPGLYSGTFAATNAAGTTTQAFTFTITSAPSFESGALTATLLRGTAASLNTSAVGWPQPSHSVQSGSLPPGLTLSSTGTIAGTPTSAGTYSGVIAATNVVGTATRSFTLTVNAAPTFSASTLTLNLTRNASANVMVAAAGTPTPTHALQSGALPTGLTLSAAGVLSGTPTVDGTYTGVIVATNSAGSATLPFTLTVSTAPSAPAFVQAQFARTLQKGAAFDYQIEFSGYPAPTIAVTSGTLPAGLTLSSGGRITGTPSTAGSFSGVFTASNSAGSATQSFAFTVEEPLVAPSFSQAAYTIAVAAGQSFQHTLAATGSPSPTFTVASGTLPAGVTLSSAGVLSGQAAAGEYAFTVEARNSLGSATAAITLIATSPPAFAAATYSAVFPQGTYVQVTLNATGTPRPQFSVAEGTLPDGLSLSSTGVLSGTPTTMGGAMGSFSATNSVGTATQRFEITIDQPMTPPEGVFPVFDRSTPEANIAVGESVSIRLMGFSNPSATFAVTSGALPPGLTLDTANSRITGAPTTPGVYTGAITATNPAGSASAAFTFIIYASPLPTSLASVSTLATTHRPPLSLAVSSTGRVYYGTTAEISYLNADGTRQAFVGSPTSGYAEGTGTAARFNSVEGLAIDAAGTLYAADSANHVIRKITAAGVVSTLAGSGVAGNADGTGSAATFNRPGGVAVDAVGNVYVADTENHLIRKITPAGVVSRFAGTGQADFGGNDGAALSAGFYLPRRVWVNAEGTEVFVLDGNRVRQISGGTVSTVAGARTLGFVDDYNDSARFFEPRGLARDADGNFYIADTSNNAVRLLDADTLVRTAAGSATAGYVDGLGLNARFNRPIDAAMNTDGSVLIADGNSKIRTVRRIGLPAPIFATAPLNLTLEPNTALSQQLVAGGNPAPAFAVSSGALPPGVTLSSAGALSGTPSAGGTFTGVFSATNGRGFDTQAFTITVKSATTPPAFGSSTLTRSMTLNVAHSSSLSASGTPAPTFSLQSGALPPGLQLSSNGTLSGTPTSTGAFTGVFAATNSAGTATQAFTITVESAPAFTNAALSTTVTASTPFAFTLTASGYPAPTFGVSTGSLPAGLTLSSNGTLSGSPTTAGTFTGAFVATNTQGQVTQNFSLTVLAANSRPTITQQPASASAVQGTAVTFTVTAAGTPPLQYQWRKGTQTLSGQTAASLSLNAVQYADAGDYTVRITNDYGSIESSAATLTVTNPDFTTYRNRYFSTAELADLSVSGNNADPDRDGVSNLLEFALGTSPRQSDPPGWWIARENGALVFRFIRPPGGMPGITYVVQSSTNLTLWTETAAQVELVDQGWEVVKCVLPQGQTVFARLMVSSTNTAPSLVPPGQVDVFSESSVGPVISSESIVHGTDRDDLMVGRVVADYLSGFGGNDTMLGGDGDDRLSGGAGDDVIEGGNGNDVVSGDAGNDRLFGGPGNDHMFGGDGDDSIDGGDGDDRIEGGAGADRIVGGAGNDIVSGGDGADTIQGGDGDDTLRGENGDDIIEGGAGQDMISGGTGNDRIDGGDGNDVIEGGDGDDILMGGMGNDSITGGAGNDQIEGGDGNDTIEGGTGSDTINGGDGADSIKGGDDNDVINGGAGDDVLVGDAGNDMISGGTGNDVIDGGVGDDTLSGGDGADKLYGGAGNDLLHGDANDDVLVGGFGDDVLHGDAGNDLLWGGEGNDQLYGGDGDDRAYYRFGEGRDTFDGGAGNDTLIIDGYSTLGGFTLKIGSADAKPLLDYLVGMELDLKALGGNAVITAPDGATITLTNTETVRFNALELSPGDPAAFVAKAPEPVGGGAITATVVTGLPEGFYLEGKGVDAPVRGENGTYFQFVDRNALTSGAIDLAVPQLFQGEVNLTVSTYASGQGGYVPPTNATAGGISALVGTSTDAGYRVSSVSYRYIVTAPEIYFRVSAGGMLVERSGWRGADGLLPLDVTIAQPLRDGATVKLSNIPREMELMNSAGQTFSAESGEVTLAYSQLAGLRIYRARTGDKPVGNEPFVLNAELRTSVGGKATTLKRTVRCEFSAIERGQWPHLDVIARIPGKRADYRIDRIGNSLHVSKRFNPSDTRAYYMASIDHLRFDDGFVSSADYALRRDVTEMVTKIRDFYVRQVEEDSSAIIAQGGFKDSDKSVWALDAAGKATEADARLQRSMIVVRDVPKVAAVDGAIDLGDRSWGVLFSNLGTKVVDGSTHYYVTFELNTAKAVDAESLPIDVVGIPEEREEEFEEISDEMKLRGYFTAKFEVEGGVDFAFAADSSGVRLEATASFKEAVVIQAGRITSIGGAFNIETTAELEIGVYYSASAQFEAGINGVKVGVELEARMKITGTAMASTDFLPGTSGHAKGMLAVGFKAGAQADVSWDFGRDGKYGTNTELGAEIGNGVGIEGEAGYSLGGYGGEVGGGYSFGMQVGADARLTAGFDAETGELRLGVGGELSALIGLDVSIDLVINVNDLTDTGKLVARGVISAADAIASGLGDFFGDVGEFFDDFFDW